jgi:hypothetical protein
MLRKATEELIEAFKAYDSEHCHYTRRSLELAMEKAERLVRE